LFCDILAVFVLPLNFSEALGLGMGIYFISVSTKHLTCFAFYVFSDPQEDEGNYGQPGNIL
jgi:hypothetical protein